MAVDTILVIACFGVAMLVRIPSLLMLGRGPGLAAESTAVVFEESLGLFMRVMPVLVAIAVTTFALSGFYTYGRAYRSRYKVLVVTQAVALTYVLLAAAAMLVPALGPVPRGTWLLGLVLTAVAVVSVRILGNIWRRTVLRETRTTGARTPTKARDVLVIGGAGYVGSHLCRQLLDRGYHVTVLDALVYGDEGIRELRGHARFQLVEGDFRHTETLVSAMAHQDAVIHLGGLVGDPACALDESLTLQVNTASTRLVIETAKAFGVQRFVFASSCSVYGASDEILDERSTLRPVSLYAETKIDAERMLLAEHQPGRFEPTILRFATMYGLSSRPRFDLVVNLLTAKSTAEGRATIFGGGQWRPFVHVADCARSIVAVLEARPAVVGGEVFNVGSDEQNMTLAELGTIIERVVPHAELAIDVDNEDARNYRVSFHKIRTRLDFRPLHQLEPSIAEMRDAVASGRIGNYAEQRYSNFLGLRDLDRTHLLRRVRLEPQYHVIPIDDVVSTPVEVAS